MGATACNKLATGLEPHRPAPPWAHSAGRGGADGLRACLESVVREAQQVGLGLARPGHEPLLTRRGGDGMAWARVVPLQTLQQPADSPRFVAGLEKIRPSKSPGQ